MMEAERLLARLIEASGAVAFGWTRAVPVPDDEWHRFRQWLEMGYHAGMGYMENYQEIRRDPRMLLNGAKTIVSVAFNYRQPNPYEGLVATYALGRDYHKVLRSRLKKVTAEMKARYGGDWRICIDSAPILERYWAVKCGTGSRSPLHGNIIVPGVGSMVFLSEIITTLDLGECPGPAVGEVSDFTLPDRYPCPTGALQPGGAVDSRRCINYLTIEHRGPLDEKQKGLVGNAFFGCDLCQLACPSNQAPAVDILPEFQPLPGIGACISGHPGDFDLTRSPIGRKFRD